MSRTSEPDWVDVGALGDIPRRGARVVKTEAGCIAVFRTADDSVFALDDRCPHADGPLSQGIVHGWHVTCPLHNWVISLEDGTVGGEEGRQVRAVPATLRDGRILIAKAVLAARAA